MERLLSSVPDCELLLIVRPGRRGAEKRVEREILRNDAFNILREELGRDVEEVLKHAESARKGERRQLIPEPMKEAPKTKDETRDSK